MSRLTKRYGNGNITVIADGYILPQEIIDHEVNILIEPIKAALERLWELEERNTPKTPDYEADGYDDNGELIYDMAYCPNCRHYFEVGYDEPRHCSVCGQALDWRVKNNEK